MRFSHADHPGRAVRLAYCLNLHAGDELEETLAGIRGVTLPLRDRLGVGAGFGVGAWLSAAVARRLAGAGGGAELADFTAFLGAESLDPFTFNAFPAGGFHADGLKESVYRPTWAERERLEFTLDVAKIAAHLWRERGGTGHVSISTHPGNYGAWVEGLADRSTWADHMGECVEELARIEADGGPRIVLSLEAEPRASSGDSRALAEYLSFARPKVERHLRDEVGRSTEEARTLAARHLGSCLDCCHSAVEFEDAGEALALANRDGSLGKIQFSSALALADPAGRPGARAALVAMDEPRYLHQVTGRGAYARSECADLPELAAALEAGVGGWLACDEWRCHFHVPVDLERVGEGLGTTRAHADRVLALALADPGAWTTDELHVEIETYTWDVLPGPARGAGDLVDGLEREYRHVIAGLEAAGWRRA